MILDKKYFAAEILKMLAQRAEYQEKISKLDDQIELINQQVDVLNIQRNTQLGNLQWSRYYEEFCVWQLRKLCENENELKALMLHINQGKNPYDHQGPDARSG